MTKTNPTAGNKTMKRLNLTSISIGVFFLTIALTAFGYLSNKAEEYRRFQSPDGRHTLIVYRRPMLFAMRGQAGDAPGFVILVDNNGKKLKRRKVDMVGLVSSPNWTPDRVSVRLLFDWPRSSP